MPAAFLGHGNPMNALDDNRYTRAWRAFGEAVPRPYVTGESVAAASGCAAMIVMTVGAPSA